MHHSLADQRVLSQLARLKMVSQGDVHTALKVADAYRATPRTVSILKSVVAAGVTSDSSWAGSLVDYDTAVSAFIESLRGRSIFYTLLPDMRRVPLATRVAISTAALSGGIVGNGAPIQLSALVLGDGALRPIPIAAMAALSKELIRAAGPDAEEAINRELRGAVADSVDAAFLSWILDSNTPLTAASGTSALHALADLQGLLDDVNGVANEAARLHFVMHPGVANRASTLATTSGALVFPNMTPTGGELLGVPAMPSSQVGSGELYLIDCSQIAAGAGSIRIDTSDVAAIQLTDAPTVNAGTGTAANLVSGFQTGMSAIRAVAEVNANRLRESAVAGLTGVAWAQAPGS